jgi:hypothetical protein
VNRGWLVGLDCDLESPCRVAVLTLRLGSYPSTGYAGKFFDRVDEVNHVNFALKTRLSSW